MIRSSDGKNFRRIARTAGDRIPAVGIKRPKAFYTAVGGETSLDLNSLSPQISYQPGQGQLEVKSSAGPMIEGLDYYETSATSITFPSPGLSAGERLEIIQTLQYTGNLVAQTRPDEWSMVATAGQTVFDADFSWPYNQNPSKRHGGVLVYVNGILQQRGSSQDYVESQIGSQANTNRITLNSPCVGGENVSILRAYQAIDETAASTQFNNTRLSELQDHFKTGFQAFVDEASDMISVPFTTIQKRANIPNPANDLRASFGTYRIHTQRMYQIQDEFSSSGDPVWGIVGDDRGMIRIVSPYNSDNQTIDNYGPRIHIFPNDICEITFYGTGLNILCLFDNATRQFVASVDGGANGPNLFPASGNGPAYAARGYPMNVVLPVTSGLSLGVHTVKITSTGSGAQPLPVFGFEILNNSSATNLTINPGSAYSSGRKITSLAGSSSLLAKPASVTGGRGGRVVVYMNPDGTFGQAVQLVNASQANLTSADHTNEEVTKVYYPREFGAGRLADDFSRYIGSLTAAFTLDDGTTTLAGTNASLATSGAGIVPEGVGPPNAGDFITFTFIGTGLDVRNVRNSSLAAIYTITVDNVAIATTTAGNTLFGSAGLGNTVKIVSGLPYGVHTVRIAMTTSGAGWVTDRFIVYGPKKPSIPSGSVEIADYNVVADYNGATATGTAVADNDQHPQGTIAKMAAREFALLGTGWGIGVVPATMGGQNLFSANNGDAVRYTFNGSGVVLLLESSSAGAYDFSVSIDGALNASGVIRSNASNLGGGSYRSTVGSYGSPVRIEFTGLSLTTPHTIIITKTAGPGSIGFAALHLIQPTHSPGLQLPVGLQNTSSVGSRFLSDSRITSPVKGEKPSKNMVQAVGYNSAPTTTVTTGYVPLADMTTILKVGSGTKMKISWALTSTHSTTGTNFFRIFVNGIGVGPEANQYHPVTNAWMQVAGSFTIPVEPGSVNHVALHWYTNTGTATAQATNRVLTVEEVP